MFRLTGLLAGFFFLTFAHAAIDGRVIQRIVARHEARANPTQPADQVASFTQKLDHFSSLDNRTFEQRYAIYYSAGKTADAPVFLYQGGEENAFDYGGLPAGVAEVAQKMGAIVVSLEHRFYGKSQPFADLTTSSLKYLSYEQSLEDTANFQRFAMNQLGYRGKWIIVGGSYPGALAAYYRLKHPDLVVGAWSSSGVVKNVEAYESYDYFVAKGLNTECLGALQDATRQIESLLKDPATNGNVKAKFQSGAITDDIDFLSVVAAIPSFAVQYGQQEFFCRHLTGNDRVTALANVGALFFKEFSVTPLQLSTQGASSTEVRDYEDAIGFRQWYWQSCTEFGGFAVSYHDPAWSAQSARLNLAYDRASCERMFGLKTPPTVERMNQDYFLPLLSPTTSQIFYTNGSLDPYAPLSISQEAGNATNPNTTAFTLKGGSHCSDLGSNSSEAIVSAQSQFENLASKWMTSK